MARPEALEEDAPIAEPLAALYARITTQAYLLWTALAVIATLGVLLYRLGAHASAHVYEVHPDGTALYVGSRESNLAPRPSEAQHVAREFAERLYAWNSSTVLDDMTAAVNLCARALGAELTSELAASQFVDTIRKRRVRSELRFEDVAVTAQSAQDFHVHLRGVVDVFALTAYEGEPLDRRPFALSLVLGVVPRDPTRRLNGLEVVRITRESPNAQPVDQATDAAAEPLKESPK